MVTVSGLGWSGMSVSVIAWAGSVASETVDGMETAASETSPVLVMEVDPNDS